MLEAAEWIASAICSSPVEEIPVSACSTWGLQLTKVLLAQHHPSSLIALEQMHGCV